MAFKRVSPEEARDLMEKEGYVYVDVRSVPEFEGGHPTGAYNVPLLQHGPGGMMAPNPDFMVVLEKSFSRDSKIIVGCQMGGRSNQAASLLTAAGWTNVIDQRAGYQGTGEPGWAPQGLPTSRSAEAGRSYDALKGGS